MLDELLSLKAGSELLAPLGEPELWDLAAELKEVRCAPGEALMRAGTSATACNRTGRAAGGVGRAEGGQEQVVGEIGPGDVSGEVSLYIGGERTATVRALTACRHACLSQVGFASLLEKHLPGVPV